MAKYLISFPSAAMVVPDGEWGGVGRDAHAVVDKAKAAGVYVFGGGIDEAVPPVLVSADGTFSAGGYSWAPPLNGGFTGRGLPSRERAKTWGRASSGALPLPPRAKSVLVRSRFLRSMVPLSLVPAEQPNNALEPTPVSAFSPAFAVDITSPAWLSLSRYAHEANSFDFVLFTLGSGGPCDRTNNQRGAQQGRRPAG